jgi:hypothetical protein
MSHTPAPWRVDASEDTFGFHNYTINGRGNRDEREDNARLIEAAPELLQLLVESQEYIGGNWRDRRDAAIAKATGGAA